MIIFSWGPAGLLFLFFSAQLSAGEFLRDEEFSYMDDGKVFRHGQVAKALTLPATSEPVQSYRPTLFENAEEAYALYYSMRTDYQEEAQCTNMAHVWASEAYKKQKINSMKIFLFFTKKYIRKYKFPWWFHVSPMTYVKSDKATYSPLVLDRRYTTYPMDIDTWTDHFIQSGVKCRPIKTMSQYFNHKGDEDCFYLTESMYYWQPRDVRLRDEQKLIRKSFKKSEVDFAYAEAF